MEVKPVQRYIQLERFRQKFKVRLSLSIIYSGAKRKFYIL